jgi:signal transduction histidine kinase
MSNNGQPGGDRSRVRKRGLAHDDALYASLVSACANMDLLQLPTAIGRFDLDRLVFANDTFLRLAGLQHAQLSRELLSEYLKFESTPTLDQLKGGRPIKIYSVIGGMDLHGYAAFADEKIIYFCLPFVNEPAGDFKDGMIFGEERERRKLARYFHDQLAPDLLALIFLIEAIGHRPNQHAGLADTELGELRDRLGEMLQSIRGRVLNSYRTPDFAG